MFRKTIILFLIIIFINWSTAAQETLEIFSWWTAPGEKDGLALLLEHYQLSNPTGKIINAAVEGGAGTNAKSVLKTRMLAGNPPDSFQVHGGAELIHTWVKAGYLKPITDLWNNNNWENVFPSYIKKSVVYKGNYYAIPLNIHRSNCLWYNPEIFSKLNISPPKNWREFFEVAKILKDHGIIPLALSSTNKWPVAHIFEALLISTGGVQFYKDLTSGYIPWSDKRVINSLQLLKEILVYTNPDHATLNWNEACNLLLEEKAAMTIMGTWAQGFFRAHHNKKEMTYLWQPVPGTSDAFLLITDTFSLPKNSPNPQAGKTWLKNIALKGLQLKASQMMGSLPARTDINYNKLPPLSRKQWQDFHNCQLVPSIVHGLAMPATFVSTLIDELAVFIYEKSPQKTAQNLEDKAVLLGIRKSR